MEKGVLHGNIDKNRKGGNKNQSGYTLVELIVVICIVLILAGGAVFGVMTWIRWSQFKEQNEYAKTLFSAAQNQLTEYSENGRLDKFRRVLASDGGYKNKVNVKDLFYSEEEGSEAYEKRLDLLWPASAGKTDKEKYRGEICYLKGNGETYKQYQEYKAGKGEKPDEEILALYDMLLPYVYDSSILNAAVCVEFTPEEGQVFSVLYSNQNDDFEYNSSNHAKRGTVDITNRETSVRKERMVGYYGVDSLAVATTPKAEQPSIKKVKLNNEGTLNLSFMVTNKDGNAVTNMDYTILVLDKDTDNDKETQRLKIVLDGRKLTKKENTSEPITCSVTRYDTDGKEWTTSDYPMLAWLENENTVRLILDAADLSAATYYYNELYGSYQDNPKTTPILDNLKNTYSFHRFCVDTENILCKVKGVGKDYKPTAVRKSNVSHTYFGEYTKKSSSGTDKVTYTLKNARHLYNVRYVEDFTPKKAVSGAADRECTYQLAENINWQKFIKDGYLYDTDNIYKKKDWNSLTAQVTPVKDTATPFPSVGTLKSTSVLEGADEKTNTISGLIIKEDANSSTAVYGTEINNGKDGKSTIQYIKNGPAGLFVKNEGKITNMVLDQISVEGSASVGAFCGENKGTLVDLTVANSDAKNMPSTVVGKTDVGGIAGKDTGSLQMQYKNLVNRASVRGVTYVGGIIGQLKVEKDDKTALIEWCKNYGAVEAAPVNLEKNQDKKKMQEMLSQAKYIGGIVGLCSNKTNKADNLQVSNCVSSPQYLQEDMEELFAADEKLLEKLNGVYVGGIAGYNENSKIINCNTEQEKNKEGYIFGYQYVGGIVGFNESLAEANLDGKDESNRGEKNTNEANVIGCDYVGGICGINAARSGEDNEFHVANPDYTRNEEKIVANWINEGIVAGYGNYVGGITGLNTGIVENCSSEVAADDTARNITDAASLKGDYVGGIAGYNNGKITSGTVSDYLNTTIRMVCYITGRNYVGGIVGYNDVDASVENYELEGGFIKGTGVFVGGYAGFNSSVELLRNNTLKSNPNEVTGGYCVSGTIGGNIISTDDRISTEFTTDNFLGKVYATAFTGGFIGYNRILPDLDVDAKSFITNLSSLITEAVSEEKSLSENVKYIDDSDYDPEGNKSEGTLTIKGIQEHETEQSMRFGSLTGDIYVGGVIGYNSPYTSLTIKNVVNKTPITALSAIENDKESQNEDQYGFLYSYAGGVIGRSGIWVEIDNCRNMDVGDVVTQGTYLGGICEVNEGLIKNCSVSSIGTAGRSYVGGITGFNKGEIKNCSFTNKTITGNDYVGGIAAQNYGTISGTWLFGGIVNASGSYVGGIAGANSAEGSIILIQDDDSVSDTSMATANAEIKAGGTYVGGITGYNAGQIQNKRNVNDSEDFEFFTFTGSIIGDKMAGGFVGESVSENQVIQNVKNAAIVVAGNGNAGGIVGITSGGIDNCWNAGNISAASEGDAGGIVSVNYSDIKNCSNTGTVSAANGMCGGITGENSGIIEDSFVRAGNETLIFEGMKCAGGISGINKGTISACKITGNQGMPVIISNTVNSKVSDVGAVTGINYGDILLTEDAVVLCEVRTYTSGSSIGGIAGSNLGTIANSGIKDIESNSAVVRDTKISFAGTNANYANIGGAAGVNDGSINRCNISADITGDLGTTDTGYGGIAGVNNSSISKCAYSGNLLTNGSADNIVNLGGIAGRNNAGGSISNSYVGFRDNTLIETDKDAKKSGVGYAGGIAGWNDGYVADCDNYSNSTKNVQINNRSGHTGGIVGYQTSGAAATGSSEKDILSTGENWSVKTTAYSNDFGVGGIIGYSASGVSMQHVANYAAVVAGGNSENVTAGGLIGRLENKDSSSMTVSDFYNYGNISGKLSAGGIGRLKYKGIAMSNCTNYGNIQSNGSAAAGIIATFYQTDQGAAVVFDSCKNYGNISARSNAGGIVGYAHDTAGNIKGIYTDCVNEGCITGGTAGGILGNGDKQDASFYRCRNYGNNGNTNTKMAGIVNKKYTSMFDCISIGDSKNVANSSSGNITDSYYLGTGELEPPPVDDKTVYISEVSSNSAINNYPSDNLWKEMDGEAAGQRRFKFSKVNNNKLTFNFYKGYPLTNFGVYWANDDTNANPNIVRQYKFKISCNNGAYYLGQDGKWIAGENNGCEFIAYGQNKPNASYWSTNLDGNTIIKNIRFEFTRIMDGTIKEGVFNAEGTEKNYICVYAVSASQGDTSENGFTSTVDSYLESLKGYISAKTKLEECQKEEQTAKDEWGRMQEYLKDWTVQSTTLDGKKVLEENGTYIFNNLSKDVSGQDRKRYILDNRSGGNGFLIKLSPPESGAEKIDSLKILWAGSSSLEDDYNSAKAEVRQYSYKVKINYKDGTFSGDSDSDRISHGDFYDPNKEVDLSDLLTKEKEVSSIEIMISKVTGNNNVKKGFACLWYVALGNTDFVGEGNFTEEKYQEAKTQYEEKAAARQKAQDDFNKASEDLEKSPIFTGSIKNAGLCSKKSETEDSGKEDSLLGYKSIVIQNEDGTYEIKGSEAVSESPFNITGLKLNPASGWNDKSSDKSQNRYKVYEEVDPKIVEYYLNKTPENPDDIKGISIDNTGGELKITWGHTGRKYYADQFVFRVTDKNNAIVSDTFNKPEEISYGIEKKTIRVPEEWVGCKIEVYIRSIGRSYVETEYTEEKYGPEVIGVIQKGASAWAGSSRELLMPQAAPKIHLELGAYDVNGKAGWDKFVAVLENKDDYKDDKATKIKLTILNKNITIDTEKGISEGFVISSNGNQVMTSYAEAVPGKYEKSTSVSVQSAIYGWEALKNNDYVKTIFHDFYGDRPGNLYNQVMMEKIGDVTELYMNSELLVNAPFDLENGEIFHCNLTLASGNSHVASNGVEMTSKLNHLPDNLLDYDSITVRTYPWRSQSDVCWYGHQVAENITEEELLRYIKDRNSEDESLWLRDTSRNNEPVFGEDGLANGYILRRDTDGKYEIIYSSILAYGDEQHYLKQVDQKKYTVDQNACKVTAGSYSRDIQPKPVIENIMPLQEDGVNYVFTWDVGIGEQDAVYDITLKGYTSKEDKTGVLLGTSTVDKNTPGSYQESEKSWSVSFEDKERTWNYPRVSISIVRAGTANAVSGSTIKFPSGSEMEFAVPLRLSQISKPVLQLHTKEEGTEKNSLLYDTVWDAVPKEERPYTAAYEVCVQRAEGDESAVSSYTEKAGLDAALETAGKLYGKKPEVDVTEGEQEKVYSWVENVDGNKVEKTMALIWTTEGTYTLTKNLTEIWTFASDDEMRDSDTWSRILDLNDYERGEMITVSVRACADETTTEYRDGTDGVAREITLPNRLTVPDTANLTASPEYMPHEDGVRDTFVTLQEFIRDGVTLSMSDTGENYYRGKYQIAAAVFDEREADDVSVMPAGDAPSEEDAGGYWNSGAVATLKGKAAETAMTGDFADSTYTLENIDPAYAGKWLKIALRSVSDSNISSWWSDEDDTTENTVNYQWIRIPRIRVEEPKITEGAASVYYDLTSGNCTLESVPEYVPAVQTELDFKLQSYSDGYRIQRIRKAKESNTDELNAYRYDADWIYLEDDNNGGYNIFCSTSADTPLDIQSDGEEPVCREDETAVFVQNIQAGDTAVLPVKEETVQNILDKPVSTQMILSWTPKEEEKEAYFRLILPDAETIMDYADEANLFTSQASVQAVILGDDPEQERLAGYESSEISSWYRYKPTQIEQATAVTTLYDYSDAVEVQNGVSIEASVWKDTAYKLTEKTADGYSIYQVKILDSDQERVLDLRNLSAYYDISSETNILALKDAVYAQYAGKWISFREARVTEANGGNISRWSDWTVPIVLPKLIVESPEVTETTAQAEYILHRTQGDDVPKQFDARQYSWLCERGIHDKIEGYQIQIGQGEDSFYAEIKRDEDNIWYYTSPAGEQIAVTDTLTLLQTESTVQEGAETYTLSAEVILNLTQTENGWQFTVTVPVQEISVKEENNRLSFTFDCNMILEPIPVNHNYETN